MAGDPAPHHNPDFVDLLTLYVTTAESLCGVEHFGILVDRVEVRGISDVMFLLYKYTERLFDYITLII